MKHFNRENTLSTAEENGW